MDGASLTSKQQERERGGRAIIELKTASESRGRAPGDVILKSARHAEENRALWREAADRRQPGLIPLGPAGVDHKALVRNRCTRIGRKKKGKIGDLAGSYEPLESLAMQDLRFILRSEP
jgi:hypothetical protein